jgi:pimeloyl-ACP methyl ester carboxylesterase
MPEKENLIAELESNSTRLASTCADGELAWRRWGAGPPMVLLHGGTGSWTHWVRNIRALAEANTVWVPDMPGFGDSASPPRGANVASIAGIVADGIERLVQAPVVLAGFSFGGLVAGNLAADRPALVRHLVLVGAGGLGLRDGKRLPLVAWRHLKDEAERSAAHRHNLANLMLWDATAIDPLALTIQSENAQRSRINSGPFSRGDVLLEPLARVKAPVDGIWGRHDATIGNRIAEVEPILRRTDPGATLLVIEDAGHWVTYERAAKFNAVMVQAVRTRSRPAALAS